MTGEYPVTDATPGAPPLGLIRYLTLAGGDLFARRAARFRQLAVGHSLGGYLSFLALLAEAQQEALNRFPPVPRYSETPRSADGRPPLDTSTWQRDPVWRQGLAVILEQMEAAKLPPAAGETVSTLRQASDTALEETADRVLAGDLAHVSPQELPFVAAALQVSWVWMASSLDPDTVGRAVEPGICPVCGSRPTVGMVLSGGSEQGLRYLCCSLCASRWHLVRLTCSHCNSTQGVNHYTLEGSDGAVKAESCDQCNAYLKLLYLEKGPQMDPLADDLATLSLDLLMDRKGKERSGPNLFLHPGKAS